MKKIIALLLVLSLVLSFAACGKNDTASGSGDKNVHTEGGVEISKEAFPEDTVLKVETVKTEDKKYQTVKTALPKAVKIEAYEITAESEGVKVQPNGTVQVTFPVPESYDSAKHDIEVYYVADDGKTEKITANLSAEGVVAELKHFSTYVVILVEKQPAEPSSSTPSSSEPSSSTPSSSTPSSSKPSSSKTSSTQKPVVKVPTIDKATAEKMLSKFYAATLASYKASDAQFGDFYNKSFKDLNDLTVLSFLYNYCREDIAKYRVEKEGEFPVTTVPKSVLDTLAKRHLGYTYDFTKNYTFDDFVVAVTYDSKAKNVIFTEGGGGMGGPDGFKVMSFKQTDDTLKLDITYHTITEEKPQGTEGKDWVDGAKHGCEGAYFELSDPSVLTFKYVDKYWKVVSYKAK